MYLLNLPNEILLCIANSLDQARDLLALACLNRAANNLFLDSLYRFNVRRQRSSSLFWGVRRGKSEFVEMMLRDYQADANTIDGRSRTPIFYAIRTKNETMIRTLLFDKRADIDWQDHRGQTPLVYAIASNLLSTASLLVDFDPCLNIRDAKNRSAIWYAIALCDENLVQVLLERGSDIRTPDYKRFSPFSLAIAKKTPGITRLLLLQSDPNSRKALLEDVTIRNRLLRQAVQACLQDVISLLVAQGADPNSRNRDGQSLLHQATKNGDAEVVQQLLTYEEISINATDRQSCTALHIAAEYGCTSVAKCLLAKCGIDCNARDSYGRTAFHIAAEYGNKWITGLLLAYGAVDINATDTNGATALCLAAGAKHTTVALQILAENHVDLNVAGQISRTALHHAARTGNIPITCVLLANEDLDPNVRDDHQWAPLTYAASNGDLRMVELFLARGDIQVNVQQAPPLFHAAKQGHVEVVRRLLQFDTVDVNQQFWNSSPLCVASEMGHPEVTRLLLEHTTPPDTNLIWETLHFPWPLTMAIWLSSISCWKKMGWMLPLPINLGTRRYAKQLGMDTNRLSSVSTGTLAQNVLVM
jgi:ankyrin repeat protein